MATPDEDKVAKALAAEVDEPQVQDEPKVEPTQPEPAADEPVAQPEEEQDKPVKFEEEATSTFTKPQGYEWVKGDTLEEFNQNLLVAYENSTAEALRLRQATPATPVAPTAETPAPAAVDPAIAYAQAMMQRDMVDSFNDFAKSYPQSREPQGFDQFEKASAGASQAFLAAFGRVPTYPELFEKTAQLLGWQPSDKTARKDAAIKDTAASTGTSSPTSAPPKRVNVTAKQLEIARRIPGSQDKSDAELVKELQPYIN